MKWLMNDFQSYDYWMDYFVENSWPMNGFRQATMTPHYCYEERIDTHEIPNEPTFSYWVATNMRYTLIPENSPHHEYNI